MLYIFQYDVYIYWGSQRCVYKKQNGNHANILKGWHTADKLHLIIHNHMYTHIWF